MQLLLATRNRHKIAELRALLGEGYDVLGLADIAAAGDVVEDQPTFAGNAAKKALHAAGLVAGRMLVLADDSGLAVDALGGAPGVLSARYAQELDTPRPTDQQNNEKLLRELAAVPAEKRRARFLCVIAVAGLTARHLMAAARDVGVPWESHGLYTVALCPGACEGRILFAPRGRGGFGYDPLFVPDGHEQTFAELGEEAKNQISHRARAMRRAKELLESLRRMG
ncbi:MAG: non-canonical purine NTP pyrophosphatase [Verrucomicrobiae bacterium]|nr:non-canonical purine NTP pyrophosphatase [Verrucomicrobiae bacterium]